MTLDLFPDLPPPRTTDLLVDGAWVLRGFALDHEAALLAAVEQVLERASLRQMTTPGGRRMSVNTSSCGTLGWVSDTRGYRYSPADPVSGAAWPAMPEVLRTLAANAARTVGFAGFAPDACLINQYVPGARMTLHQDRNERDYGQPIVSVSLGLPAVFQFGGRQRAEPVIRTPLAHGDVAVWGGPARMRFHGVLPLKPGVHPKLGVRRINLTFRKAG
jgi:DNA oxidative demethylase